MATTLAVGDIAIVHYNSGADPFSFVFLRDVEAGTTINFTDNGWLAAGGFRGGESTVTYTAPTAITAGTIATLSGLFLATTGDQIIAYQGDAASPTILHLVDLGDDNNTVAGDATDAQTTALPPGFTLGVNAVAIAFDDAIYAGPTSGSPEGLFAALNNSANWLGGDALPVGLTFNAKPILDLDSDNSTHLGRDYETSVVSGGPAVPVADIDLDIDDPDDFDLFAAEFRIFGFDVRDLLAVNGTLPGGIVATAYQTSTGVLRLEGRASHEDYETAIRQVMFSTTDTVGDQKRIKVSVFDGQAWSKDVTAFIEVVRNLTAAPPGLDLDANNSSGGGADATATYTAGGPAMSVTDIDVSITADTPAIESATITILGWSLHPGDTLSIAGTLPAGITASSYNPFTGVITLSGSASPADYQTALRQVVYSSTLGAPSTADRGIQLTVTDGSGLISNLATMYMHVLVPPPNVAPVLDLDANNSTTPGASYLTGFTEGGPPVAIADTDVLAIDSDNPNLASASITLTNPQAGDVLAFDGTPPAGITVSGSGTSIITLTGVAPSASYQLALQQIKFDNSSIDPSNITRTVEVHVSDGTSNSNTATALVQVEAVNNSAPVIDLDPDDSTGTVRTTFRTVFTENGTPIPIADADVSITDLDSPTLVFATITLANQRPGDLLTVATPPLPGGILASAYDPATGVLTLTGTATLDDYEAALRQIRYSNDSDNPDTVDRLIEVVVNDGANTSNVAAAVIGVVPVNDAPDVVLEGTVYLENAATVTLDPLARLADVDDDQLSQVVIRITSGVIPGDGDTLTVGGLTGGTVDGITFLWDAAEHAMVLTGASSVLNYQNLLRTVGYHSTSDNPTEFGAEAIRILTWNVSDGTAVTTTTTTLDILAVNDAPQATIAATASYTENAAPVVLSPASTASDADNIVLVSGEVRIVSGAVAGDLLTVNGLQSGTFLGIEFSYDPLSRSLTFTHPTLVADYEAFLEAVAFSSTSDDPTNSGLNPTRTLSWFLFDGEALSDARTTVLSISALNDAPVNAVPGTQSVNEDTALAISGLSVSDVDTSDDFQVNLTAGNGTLTVPAGGGASVSGNGTGAIQLLGTLVQVNAALAGLQYRGNANFTGTDTLTIITDDSSGGTDSDTVAITVNPVNDRPVLDLDANNSSGAAGTDYATTFTEGGAAVAVADLDDLITDVDNTNLASATITLANHQPADLLGVIGALPAGITASGYDPTTGVLTLSGAAPLVAYQTALRQIAFSNSSPIPSATDRIVNIVVNDGAASSFAAHTFVHVVPVDTAPALDLDADNSSGLPGANYTAVFTGGGAAVPVADADTLVADADNADILSATITLTNAEATDLLSVNGTLPAGITAAAFDPLTGILTLTGSASRADYQTALRQIEYDSSVPTPLTATRVVKVVVNDGTADSNAALSLIQIALAAPPTLDLDADDSTASGSDYATTFTEDGGGVTVADADIAISSPTLVSATITLTNLLPGDVLSVNGTLPAGVTHVYDPGTGVMTLTGPGLTANFQAAADQIVYSNTTNNPSTEDRIITVVVNDGINDSNTASAIVGIAAVNDAPSLSVSAAASYTENGAPLTVSPTATVSDPDSPTLTIGIVTITTGLNPGDVLTVGGLRSGRIGSITFDWAPALNELIVTGAGSPADYEALFQAVRFFSDSDDPTNGGADTTRTISWAVFDGTSTIVSTTTLTISAVNDPPVNIVPGAQSVTEDAPLPIAGVSVADVDSASLTTTLTVTNGTLNVTPGVGVTGNGTGAVTITATAGEINTALAGLSYTGNLNFNGLDTLTVTTGDGTTPPDIDTIAVNVSPVNDAPVLGSVAASAAFTEGGPATTLSSALTTADADNASLASAAVSITAGFLAGDVLTATTTGTSIAASYDSATGILTLTGADTLAHYQQVLDSVTYQSTAADPTNSGLNPTRTIEWLVNDGEAANNLSLTQITTVMLTAASPAPGDASGDFNGDFNPNNRSDILWRADNGEVSIWDMANAGAAGAYHVLGMIPMISHVNGAGDFNGDGRSDLLWRADNGEVSIWEMANAGQVQSYHVLDVIPTTSHIRGIGDFSGDGKSDILWRADNGEVSIWEMANAGKAAAYHVLGIIPTTSHIQGTGDFNGDGKSDILWRADNGEVSIWEMASAGQAAAYHVLGVIPTTSHIQGTGDFNGDGKSDILWRADNGEVSIWEMANAGQAQAYHVLDVVPTTSHIRGTGDYSGDGKSDILWRADNGEVSTWEMANAGQVQSYHVLGIVQTISHIQHAGQFDLV